MIARNLKLLLLLVFSAIGLTLLRTNSVSAISNQFLNTSPPFGGNIDGLNPGDASLVVEHTDAVSVPQINLKWFVRQTYSGNPDLRLTGFCSPGNSQAYARVLRLQPDGSWLFVGANLANFTAPGYVNLCVGNDLVVTGVSNNGANDNFLTQTDPLTGLNLYEGFDVALLEVHLLDKANFGGLTKFNAVVTGGGASDTVISQAELGGNLNEAPLPPASGGFAILGDYLGSGYGYNASFTFRANCSEFTGGITSKQFYLHWRDADGWSGVYGSGTSWQLYDITTGVRVPVPGASVSGIGLGASSNLAVGFPVNLSVNRTYEWRWSNIHHLNVIHMWMPFSEVSTLTPACDVGNPIGFADSCEVNASGQTVIKGWAYDNDDANGPQVQLNLSGIGSQTVTANLGTYAPGQSNVLIHDALNIWGFGTNARDNRYGWEAIFNGVLTGGTYNLSGTVLDAGPGSNPNQPLGLSGVFGPGGSLPSGPGGCLYTPPPPTADLWINGQPDTLTISEGGNINVTWDSTNANSCTASRTPLGASTWTGNKATANAVGENHNADSAVLGTFTYSITCTGLTAPAATDQVVLTIRQVPSKPYFQVFNGDVSSGVGFGSSCSTVSNAPIAAYNNGSPGYLGASTRLAAFDLGTVTQFSTGIANPGINRPEGLTFANTGAGAAGSEYGGGLSSNACAIDYYNLPKTNAVAWGGSFSNGEYTSGSLTLAGGGPVTVAANNKITLFVNGDAYIRNNITINSATTYNAMSTFYLIVRGNIYIDYRVSQLDGIYVAQASGAANGKIYTCATSSAVPTQVEIATTTICGQNPLTVNGALVAKQVKFLRSRSKVENCTTLANCLTESAEVINFTPDMWIPPRASTPGSAKKYDAITSLPPIL
ncbi:MAG: hypothetical protein KIH63_001200 [Candidatus Saccharibacteria bacterium]|nr:hypothetical protein [Candidatus Saccharibacteria bacterium]